MKEKLKFLKPSKKTIIISAVVVILALIAVLNLDLSKFASREKTAPLPSVSAPSIEKGLIELPNEASFTKVTENEFLILYLDETTGHFKVDDKRNGNVWRSYPEPEFWLDEGQGGIWRRHLRAPIMLQLIDLAGNKSQPRETNFIDEQGTIENLELLPNGFRLTFDMPSKEVTFPIEVILDGDGVVTRIIDEGVKEGRLSLVWARLYPFFGAEHSAGQDGYLFIPDGSGALMYYKESHLNVNRVYREPIYGIDASFKLNDFDPSRLQAIMPVFGAKSGDKAFISVVEDGAEYAEIYASPSGVYSAYNWITAQQSYRSSYRQMTNVKKNQGFTTYNRDDRFHNDRSIRYILLDTEHSDYVGMAQRYRDYLMDNYGLEKIVPKSDKVPMTVNLIGAAVERGLITTNYLKQTTTSEAMQIVQRLYGLGVENMVVNYKGWQKKGYGVEGNLFPVDRRLGGNDGMKTFVDYANTLDIPVYLQANYLENTENSNGFRPRNHGLRDMGGYVKGDLVSLKWMMDKVIDNDIKKYQELGVAGVTIERLGNWLNSDYNNKYGSDRVESRELQQEVLQRFNEAGLDVRGYRSNLYVLPFTSAIDNLNYDYSYDLFSDESVPFVQIALHGLISYTSQPVNERQQFDNNFLHDLELGAHPSFVFTHSDPEKLKYSMGLHYYSPQFSDWEPLAIAEYQKYNEAFGDVQDQFIVNHRTLAPKVKETTYENGKRIIVNYDIIPYRSGSLVVDPLDYVIIKGGN